MRILFGRILATAVAGTMLVSIVQAGIRPPAVPLVSVEPHFSVWSAADNLYDTDTSHWSGVKQPLMILLEADGVTYRLCGRGGWYGIGLAGPILQQTSCRVGATTTSYVFSNGKGLSAEIDFMTPRITDDLDVFSRPVSYVTVRVKGAKKFEEIGRASCRERVFSRV